MPSAPGAPWTRSSPPRRTAADTGFMARQAARVPEPLIAPSRAGTAHQYRGIPCDRYRRTRPALVSPCRHCTPRYRRPSGHPDARAPTPSISDTPLRRPISTIDDVTPISSYAGPETQPESKRPGTCPPWSARVPATAAGTQSISRVAKCPPISAGRPGNRYRQSPGAAGSAIDIGCMASGLISMPSRVHAPDSISAASRVHPPVRYHRMLGEPGARRCPIPVLHAGVGRAGPAGEDTRPPDPGTAPQAGPGPREDRQPQARWNHHQCRQARPAAQQPPPHPAASIMRYPMGYSPWHADISMEAGKFQNLA